MKEKKFKVGLSFPGEHRDFVAKIANELAVEYTKHKVLYDKYHENRLARYYLEEYLPNLYEKECEIVAVFLCKEYKEKEWCGLEWKSILNAISLENDYVVFYKLDNVDLDKYGIVGIKGKIGFIKVDCTNFDESYIQSIANGIKEEVSKRIERSGTHHQEENKNALLPQTPLAVAGLFSRWFGDPSLFEEGGFFDEIAEEVGLSNLQKAFPKRDKIFECWYEIARYCSINNNLSKLEEAIVSNLSGFYIREWFIFPIQIHPAGSWSTNKLMQYAKNWNKKKSTASSNDNEALLKIAAFSLDEIWMKKEGEDTHPFMKKIETDLEQIVIFLKKAKKNNNEFKDKELVFALAAFYLDAIFQEKKDVEFKQNFKELLLASRKAVPSRYALMITLLQYSRSVLDKAKKWRNELIKKSVCSYNEQEEHLYLLCSLTTLLLDAGEKIVSAKEDVIKWVLGNKLEKLYPLIPDISFQLELYDYCFNRKDCEDNSIVTLSCIASARILFIEKKKKLEDYLKCKNAKCIKESIETASLSATEIYNGKYLYYLSVIKIKSKEQIDIIRKIAIKDIYAEETDVNDAIRCLCKHPVPKSTLPPKKSETRKKWLDLLVKKYKDTSCHEDIELHGDIENYFKLITDDLSSEEKENISSVMGDSHA